MEILRATILHAPAGQASILSDGAVAVDGRAIAAIGPWTSLRTRYPDATVHDLGGSLLLPGLVDTHIHFPQTGVIGAMGLPLLRWLQERTLPAEAALDTDQRARTAARSFLRLLAANGTTTALVFGSHLPVAQEAFFEEAARSGLRIVSGLSLGDRNLPPALCAGPEDCYRESRSLLERWHGAAEGRLRYAITPRFSVSCSEQVLKACGALLREHPEVLVQSHINETLNEVALVRELFPASHTYLDTYEQAGLAGPTTVLAHNLHATADELRRMADSGVGIAHCASSNMFLGSGSFPMAAHQEAGVSFALATDVGGGTGFSLFAEALDAYGMQRLRSDGVNLRPGRLLQLMTEAGADLLGLGAVTGRLEPGYRADFTIVRPAPGGSLEAVLAAGGHDGHGDPEDLLGAIITLAREADVAGVWIDGQELREVQDAREEQEA